MNDLHFTTEHATVVGMLGQSNELLYSPATETLQIAFSAEFHIDAQDPALAATDVHEGMRRSFQEFVDNRVVGQDASITGEEALGALAATENAPDYLITSSMLSGMDFCDDDMSDSDAYLAIASAPSSFHDAMAMLLETTDKMSSEKIRTSAPTEMTIRVSVSEEDKVISPLDLILGLSEKSWLERFGRSKAVLPDDCPWVKLTLTDVLLQEYFQRPVRLTADDAMATWETYLSELAEYVVSEGMDGVAATSIHADRKGVDFYHIGGQCYEDDFMLIHDTLSEMGSAVACSVRRSDEIGDNAKFQKMRVQKFVKKVLKTQSFADALEITDTNAPFVSKIISQNGQPIGAVQDMGVDMVKVDDIAVPTEKGNEAIYPFLAALLSERLGNT